jgi:hypothetical protein
MSNMRGRLSHPKIQYSIKERVNAAHADPAFPPFVTMRLSASIDNSTGGWGFREA